MKSKLQNPQMILFLKFYTSNLVLAAARLFPAGSGFLCITGLACSVSLTIIMVFEVIGHSKLQVYTKMTVMQTSVSSS